MKNGLLLSNDFKGCLLYIFTMMCWIFQDKTGSRSYFGVGMPTLPTSTIALAGIQTLVYYMQLYFSKFC